MTIRDFELADQAAVENLITVGLRERWGVAFDDSYNTDLADIAGHYQETGASVVVVEVDHAIVATGTLLFEEPEVGRIVRMSVAPANRRQGLGRQVVEELIKRATSAGLTELHVSTDTPWTSALALYRACGFEEVRRDKTDTYFTRRL